MECDDLKNCVCKYSDSRPVIPASQVHILMWEKQSKNSAYKLPCEREPLRKVGKVQQCVADHVLSNAIPPPVLTSVAVVSACTIHSHVPVTSLSAATIFKPSSLSLYGAAPISVQVAPLKDQDGKCSKSCRKTADNTRLQRMKQKYELDRKRSSSLNLSKPVIPRIPIGFSTTSEQPEKKNVLSLPGKMDLSDERYSPSKIAGCISVQKLSRTYMQSITHENNMPKSNTRAGRHNLATVQTRSLLKVGRQSYLESILPLITERKQSTAAVQKFEAYVPKSQKVPSASVNETLKASVTDRRNTVLDLKSRKPRVCFSECNLQNDKQHQLPENVTNGLSVNQMPTKSGILAKPHVLPKSTSPTEQKFCFDDADFDFSSLMDFDKILFEDNNSLVTSNASVTLPLLHHNGGDASNCISTTTESCATVCGDVAVHSSLPNLGDFISSGNWTSSSGSSNIISDFVNSSVVNSSLSNNAIGNYLNGTTSGVHGYAVINDNAVTGVLCDLPSANELAEDFTNIPLHVQSFNFGEEDWSWFS